MTLPFSDSPPIASEPPLSASQLRFLTLHARHLVTSHQWHLSNSQLRATTDTGRRAYLWRDELDDLVRRNFMARGVGCADVKVTEQGRAQVQISVDLPHC